MNKENLIEQVKQSIIATTEAYIEEKTQATGNNITIDLKEVERIKETYYDLAVEKFKEAVLIIEVISDLIEENKNNPEAIPGVLDEFIKELSIFDEETFDHIVDETIKEAGDGVTFDDFFQIGTAEKQSEDNHADKPVNVDEYLNTINLQESYIKALNHRISLASSALRYYADIENYRQGKTVREEGDLARRVLNMISADSFDAKVVTCEKAGCDCNTNENRTE